MELENSGKDLPYVRLTLVFPWLSTTEKQETFGDFVANLLTDSSKFLGSSSATCEYMTNIWVARRTNENSENTHVPTARYGIHPAYLMNCSMGS